MVENINDIKKQLLSGKYASKSAVPLLELYDQILEYDRKLERYTIAKCAYERNMDTCILEYLYFNNRSRGIFNQIR